MKALQKNEGVSRRPLSVLAVTLVMGAALAGIGVTGYLQASRNAETLTRAEVGAMLPGLRRAVFRGPGAGDLGAALASYFSDHEEGDFTAAAIVGADGHVRSTFGMNRRPFAPERLFGMVSRGAPGSPALRIFDDGVVHALVPFFGRGKGRRGGFGQERGLFLMVEAVSSDGPAIVSRATAALTVELTAAVLLVAIALLLIRQKAAADARTLAMEAERREMAVALERDERLKALGRMSAVLGHELRNPIAALKGHAQLLLEEAEAGRPVQDRAKRVVSEAKLLENLTFQVLDFVRTGEIVLAKVYLDDLAGSAAALSDVAPVAIDAPEGVAWYLDRARMEQALINLLVNAAQAGEVGAEIGLAIDCDEETLRISVRDRGPGIPEEDLERIFQPFYTSRAKGTGLGLALVRRIAEAHGGEVRAANHAGGGAVPTVTIPRIEPAAGG